MRNLSADRLYMGIEIACVPMVKSIESETDVK